MAASSLSLNSFDGPYRPSGEHINFKYCPVCRSDEWKLYLHPDTGLWKCFAGRHNAGGKIDMGQAADPTAQGADIMRLLEGWDAEPHVWEEIELPAWEPLSKSAKRYLRKRGIDEPLAKRLGMVEWVDKFRILVPFFDRAGSLIYWTSRRYSDHAGEGPKYLTAPGRHPLYELRGCRPQGVPNLGMPGECKAVLVEGVFDAISVYLAGYHAIALGGKSLPRYLKPELLTLTTGCGILVVMLDSDALAQAITLRNQLSDRKLVDIAVCPSGQDPGSMSPGQIREQVR